MANKQNCITYSHIYYYSNCAYLHQLYAKVKSGNLGLFTPYLLKEQTYSSPNTQTSGVNQSTVTFTRVANKQIWISFPYICYHYRNSVYLHQLYTKSANLGLFTPEANMEQV